MKLISRKKIVSRFLLIVAGHFTVTALSACTSTKGNNAPASVDAPAIRINVTADSQQELQKVISSSLHLSNVTLSEKAFTQKNTIIIEKKKPTGFDLSKPTVFRLIKRQNQCFILNQQTKQRYPLITTQCKAL